MRRRSATAAAFAVALFVVGQLLAIVHDAESRHITCDEHGEQVDAPGLALERDDGCGKAHLVGVDGDSDAEHQDCEIARLLRTSTRTSQAPQLCLAVTSVHSVERSAPLVTALSFDVILIAPKTSPPA